MRGRIAAMRGPVASFRNYQEGQIRYTTAALELLSKSDTTFRALPSFTLGDLFLHRGNVNAAFGAYQQAVDSLDETDFFLMFELIVVARILMMQGRYPEAETQLNSLLVMAERGGNVSAAIEIRCLQAICLSESGRENDAFIALEAALSEGETRGFFQMYLDEGEPLARMLYKTAARGVHQAFIQRLLSAFPSDSYDAPRIEESVSANKELFEPVTDRELDVLHLVAEGLKNLEIGERLFISTHTVKTHLKNMSAKLETHNRTEAVTKAKRLGLLPPAQEYVISSFCFSFGLSAQKEK